MIDSRINNVQVSVLCTAYNHGKYLRQCLDGFVMQKDISLEIIIHDDASIDDTAEIIREYEKKYPKMIKPIYQIDNQFSQGNPFILQYMLPRVTGKYIAICEGDDYWTDPYKLKKQVDVMESNNDCFLCLHRVNVISEDGVPLEYSYPRCRLNSGKIKAEDFFRTYMEANYYHTSSYFILADKYIEYEKNKPRFAGISPVGDEAMLLYFPCIGNVYYIDEVMSSYRFESIGGWTYNNSHGNEIALIKRRKIHLKEMINSLNEFCSYSGEKYNKYMVPRINSLNVEYFYSLVSEYRYSGACSVLKTIKNEFNYRKLRNIGLSKKTIYRAFIQLNFPRLMKVYDKLKIQLEV